MVQAIEAWAPHNGEPRKFTSTDMADLTWFFQAREAAYGVCSTWERQVSALIRMTVSDDVRREMNRRRKMLRAKLEAPKSAPKPKTFEQHVGAAILDHLGIEPVLEAGGYTAQEIEDGAAAVFGDPYEGEEQRALDRMGHPWEYMHLRETGNTAPSDPYPDDGVCRDVKRSRPIEAALGAIPRSSFQILRSAYGAALGDEDNNRGLQKKFGSELVELVVDQVAHAMNADRVKAREVAFWKTKDASFVMIQKRAATRSLEIAQVDYVGARWQA